MAIDLSAELRTPFADEAARLFRVFGVAKRRGADGLGEGVYRPGGREGAQTPDDLPPGDDGAQAEAGDRVELGERPQDDEIRRSLPREEALRLGEIGEGLVDDEDRFRPPEGELAEGAGGRERAGRIVRPAQDDDLIPAEDRFDLGELRDEAPLLPKRNLLHDQSRLPGRGGVVGIGGDGDYGAPFPQDPRQEIEELRLPVSHEDLVGRDAEALREGPDEIRAVRVGVVDKRAHPGADQGAEPFGRPQGVDVGRKIEDLPGGPPRGRGKFRDIPSVLLRHAPPPESIAAATRAGTSSVSSQEAPSVSPVRPPIRRKL